MRSPSIIPVTPFGKYTLIARLGHGGMAEVYLALSTGPAGFRKLVVIKRIHEQLEEERRLVEMFLDEARLAARLNHPCCVQTNEVGEANGSHYLAMEFLEGQPLDRVVRRISHRHQRMPAPLLARVCIDVLDGLHYAHELRDFDGTPLHVVHRDVSPQNVFVCYDGTVKVLDFGIAKASTQLVETRVGAIKGKYAYIAPEQARGPSRVDRRADLWSMGVVLWEVLAARRLFKSDSDLATLSMALEAPIPKLSTVAPDVPRALEAIADRALQRDPSRRYATALEMKADLERWLTGTGKNVGRAELGAYTSALFDDAIAEHRQLVSSCLAATTSPSAATSLPDLAGGEGSNTVSESRVELKATATASIPGVAETLGDRRSEKSLVPAIAIATILIVGAVIGAAVVVSNSQQRGSGVSEVEFDVSPSPTPTPTPTPATATDTDTDTDTVTVTATATATATDTDTDTVTATDTDTDTERPDRPNRPWRPRTRPAPEPPAAPAPAPAPATGEGFLTLDTDPWSNVSLAGREIGQTPLIRARLPEGTHTLTLTNPEAGIRTTYRVRIRAGEVTTRRLGLE